MPASQTLAEFLATGPMLQIDPLVSLPPSLDPATWVKPQWPNYAPLFEVAHVGPSASGGLYVTLRVALRATALAYGIVALGVSYMGSGLFIAPLQPPVVVRHDFTFPVLITVQVNPVIA